MLRRLFFLFCLLAAAPARAEDDYADFQLIHADVPLWGSGDERVWPRHVTEVDGWGCAHRLTPGDWRLEEGEDDPSGEWVRLHNYGVMHCFIVESHADRRDELARSGFRYSLLLDLGTTKGLGGEMNLWALQAGARPGSDYLLLASKAGAEGPVRAFDVLSPLPEGEPAQGPLARRAPHGVLRHQLEGRAGGARASDGRQVAAGALDLSGASSRGR